MEMRNLILNTSQLHTMNWVLHNFLSLLLFFFLSENSANFENLGNRTRAIFADDISYFNKNYFEVFQIKENWVRTSNG